MPRPERLLDTPRQRLDAWTDRLPAALTRMVQARRVKLSEATGALRPGTLQSRVRAQRDWFGAWDARLAPALQRAVDAQREALHRRADRLSLRPIQRDIDHKRAQLEQMNRRLSDAGGRQVRGWRDRIAGLDRLRETLGYKATLARGYAVVRGDGAVVTTKASASKAAELEIEFSDGRLPLAGGDGRAASPASEATKKPPRSKPEPPDQGSLF